MFDCVRERGIQFSWRLSMPGSWMLRQNLWAQEGERGRYEGMWEEDIWVRTRRPWNRGRGECPKGGGF